MSLILDALKKSEAERQRGMPPTLHAHFSAPRRARRTPWVAGAGAVLLVAGLAGSGLWLARGRVDAGPQGAEGQLASAGTTMLDDQARAAANPPSPALAQSLAAADGLPDEAAVAMVPVAAPPPAAAESAFGGVAGDGAGGTVSGGGLPLPQRAMLYTPTVTPAPDSAAVQPAPVATPPVPVDVPAPVATTSTMPAEVAALPPPPPQSSPEAAAMPVVTADPPAPAAVAVAVASSKPEEVLPNVFQLPYTTRKDLPKLELSMHVFSPDASERFIVLNGKRYTLETPAPGPELSLLDIVADGAVLEFRGQRFLLPRQTY